MYLLRLNPSPEQIPLDKPPSYTKYRDVNKEAPMFEQGTFLALLHVSEKFPFMQILTVMIASEMSAVMKKCICSY